MRRALLAVLVVLVGYGMASAAELTLLPLGNRGPGLYGFGPIFLPETATRGVLVMNRGNIFAKPDFRADIVGELWTPGEIGGEPTRVGGCFSSIRGGQVLFRGAPTTPRIVCSMTIPDMPGITLRGTMTVGGDSGNVELIFEHD